MITPNFDIDIFVDKEGRLTPEANLLLGQLFTNMQQNLSDEGYKLPPQDAGTIIRLNTTLSTTGILYNSTTNKAMVCENGIFKTITTS